MSALFRSCLALSLLGCAPTIPAVQTGSGTIGARPGMNLLAVVSPDQDRLSLVNVDRGRSLDLDIGAAPTRVAVVGEHAIVTLRGERALVEVQLDSGLVGRRVETGAEPYGVVSSPDERTFFVSISQEDRVEQRDADTLEVLRSFRVPGRPQGLALHPDGHVLVVASAFGEALHTVDLFTGETEVLPLPVHTTLTSGSRLEGEVTLSARVSGDPVFRHDGSELVVPVLYVDTRSGEIGGESDLGVPAPSLPYYKQAPIVSSMGRFNATLVHYDLGKDDRLELEAAATSRVLDVAPGINGSEVRQSVITHVAQAPDGYGWLVTMDASDAVLLVDDRYKKTWKRRKKLAFPLVSAVSTGRGPAGVAVLGRSSVYVHERLQRTVSDLDYRTARDNLKWETGQDVPDDVTTGPTAHSRVLTSFGLGNSNLDPDVEVGRSLFFDAVSPTMGSAGVSCSTCHVDGRTDGLVWALFNGDRNTPSLAGPVDETGVITWTNPVGSVSEEARFTVEHRMGVERLNPRRSDQIAAFVASTPYVDLPEVDDSEAIARGRALFESQETGCAGCHSGPFLTDGEVYDLYGERGVKTRPLIGIASSPPYLHDGRAATLRDVLETARTGAMGMTGHLDEDQMQDLEAYLRSL